MPRSIPAHIRPRLIEQLKPFAGQVLHVDEPNAADTDSSQFAQQIESLVTEAGWRYQVVRRIGASFAVSTGLRLDKPHGLLCAVPDPNKPSSAALALVAALKEAGAEIRLVGGRDTDPRIIGLVIGLKPIQ